MAPPPFGVPRLSTTATVMTLTNQSAAANQALAIMQLQQNGTWHGVTWGNPNYPHRHTHTQTEKHATGMYPVRAAKRNVNVFLVRQQSQSQISPFQWRLLVKAQGANRTRTRLLYTIQYCTNADTHTLTHSLTHTHTHTHTLLRLKQKR